MGEKSGLRERKKQATRGALSNAALRLAVECGLEQVTVDDIAAAADVSPRTFFNYFSSKEEAILAGDADRMRQMLAAVQERPLDEPLWDALRQAFTCHLFSGGEFDRGWVAQVRMVKSTPALLAQQLATYAELERRLAAEVAARTGRDPSCDLYPRLVAAAVVAAVRVAAEFWLDTPTSEPLADVVVRAIDQLAAGMVTCAGERGATAMSLNSADMTNHGPPVACGGPSLGASRSPQAG